MLASLTGAALITSGAQKQLPVNSRILVIALLVLVFDLALQTHGAKAQTLPFAATQPASLITSTTATLNGMAVPNGLPSLAWYEWGTQGRYDQQTGPTDLGTGTGVVRVSQPVSGLTNEGVYQFRLVASNAVGKTYGAMQLFTTGLKISTWATTGQFLAQTNAPTNVVAVSMGETISSALTAQSGTVMSSWSGGGFAPSVTNAVAISAGGSLALAVQADGTLSAWGSTTGSGYGPASVPTGLTNVCLVYAGYRYGLALGNDGTVDAWGQWSSSIPFTDVTVPAGLTNVVALSGGVGHCLALRADGTVQAWGDNFYGQLSVPAGLSNVVAIAAGDYFSVALTADGTVVSWPGEASPIASNAVAISASFTGTLVLLTNGAVLGFGSLTNIPNGLSNVVGIAAGFYGGSAVGRNLAPSAVGQNVTGAPNGPFIITLTGTDPNSDSLVFKINSLPGAGTLYQCAGGSPGVPITATNTLVADIAGRVIFVPLAGQLGSPYTSFTFVANDGEADSLPAKVTVSVLDSAYVSTQPATMFGLSNAVLHAMVLPNGLPASAWFEWGTKGVWQQTTPAENVGSGQSVQYVSSPISNLVPGMVYQCRVVASTPYRTNYGAARLLGFHEVGKVVTWGQNNLGEGDLPADLTNIVAITTGGGRHSLALKADGTVVAWGYNPYGQTNAPAGLTNVIAIGAGTNHSLAVRNDGTVVAWGANNYGQTSVPTGLSNVIAVAGGGDHSTALKADGTVVAWGANDHGQATVPSGLINVVGVACGFRHSLALLANGTVVGWGDNALAELSGMTGLSNVVAIASAGGNVNIALRADGTVFDWGNFIDPGNNLFKIATNIIAIGSGSTTVYTLSANGIVTNWPPSGRYGVPIPIALTNVVAIAGGYDYAIALADNLPPSGINFARSAYPNQDILIQLRGYDPNGDALNYRIASLPALGSLYQFASGSRGAMISLTNTLVSDPAAQLFFAPLTNALGSPYASFTYLANDGVADSPPATVVLNVVLPPAPMLSATQSLWSSTSGFFLTFSGDPNATYHLWYSTNLADWILLGAVRQASDGWFHFLDAGATNVRSRFYRAGAP